MASKRQLDLSPIPPRAPTPDPRQPQQLVQLNELTPEQERVAKLLRPYWPSADMLPSAPTGAAANEDDDMVAYEHSGEALLAELHANRNSTRYWGLTVFKNEGTYKRMEDMLGKFREGSGIPGVGAFSMCQERTERGLYHWHLAIRMDKAVTTSELKKALGWEEDIHVKRLTATSYKTWLEYIEKKYVQGTFFNREFTPWVTNGRPKLLDPEVMTIRERNQHYLLTEIFPKSHTKELAYANVPVNEEMYSLLGLIETTWGIYQSMLQGRRIQERQKTIQSTVLQDWQDKALDLFVNQGQREILFIVDQEGGRGKTFLADYIDSKYPGAATRTCFANNFGDVMYALSQNTEATMYIFDVPRDLHDIHMNILESLKNGFYLNEKYFSKNIRLASSAKIIVTSNAHLPYNLLSKDRVVIMELWKTKSGKKCHSEYTLNDNQWKAATKEGILQTCKFDVHAPMFYECHCHEHRYHKVFEDPLDGLPREVQVKIVLKKDIPTVIPNPDPSDENNYSMVCNDVIVGEDDLDNNNHLLQGMNVSAGSLSMD